MKIAIRGHKSRGKEVIQILESLGGINSLALLGTNNNRYYYIYENNTIMNMFYDVNYKIYTLEEFEKEFPFKIGDKVKHISSVCIIKEYCYINNKPCYKVESVELGIIATIPIKLLEPYKEMKEERNITLTLDKAKEWYNKGGELKEIALQAFNETELNPLPRSWEEFCKNYPLKTSEAVICTESTIVTCDCSEIRDPDCDREVCPSIKSAKAHLALIQLEQLRNCWRQGWKLKPGDSYYTIKFGFKGLNVYSFCTVEFLSFPTREMAEEFLKCFRDLIEKAGDLI